MLRPLIGCTAMGDLLERPDHITAQLLELLTLPPEELLRRAKITSRHIRGYIPSECLVYLVRNSQIAGSEQLYTTLHNRVRWILSRDMPSEEKFDQGKSVESETREICLEQFTEWLLKDQNEYHTQLDFFEISFWMQLERRRLDARRIAVRRVMLSLAEDEETGEFLPSVEAAGGAFDQQFETEIDEADYRLSLREAIKGLPDEQRSIINMTLQGIPVTSEVPDQDSMVKLLGRSDKHIREKRKLGYKALKAKLHPEDQP